MLVYSVNLPMTNSTLMLVCMLVPHLQFLLFYVSKIVVSFLLEYSSVHVNTVLICDTYLTCCTDLHDIHVFTQERLQIHLFCSMFVF